MGGMDYARYNSATASHMPEVAGGPVNQLPHNPEEIGKLLHAGVDELQGFTPGPAQVDYHAYLQGQAQQIQHNLVQAWTVPGAWMGVHQQAIQFRHAVMDLRQGPYNTGDNRQGIPRPAPTLQGLGATTAASQDRRRRDRNIMIGATVTAMVVVAGVMGLLSSSNPRGTRGVGSPHSLQVKFRNPKFPGARKAK